MVEPQIVVLVVAGSSPVGHPFLRVKKLKKLHCYNGKLANLTIQLF
jgi:hypothetical protein